MIDKSCAYLESENELKFYNLEALFYEPSERFSKHIGKNAYLSKKESKDQEQIQSSTTPDPGSMLLARTWVRKKVL